MLRHGRKPLPGACCPGCSLLTPYPPAGRAWGKEKSPGFVITNAFGGVLDQKLVAENHLRASGLDWTIVRPGGLKDDAPTGSLVISPEDTLVCPYSCARTP